MSARRTRDDVGFPKNQQQQRVSGEAEHFPVSSSNFEVPKPSPLFLCDREYEAAVRMIGCNLPPDPLQRQAGAADHGPEAVYAL